jgi:hypothetical protein
LIRSYLKSLVRKGLNRIDLSKHAHKSPSGVGKRDRGLTPVSRLFGLDRGQPIDRYYIESFLEQNRRHIRGAVLEIGDNEYTTKYGCKGSFVSHVLHAAPDNPIATIVGNLETGDNVPHEMFNCIICTQTLPFIFDTKMTLANTFSALKQGGVLLATVPGISQISRYDMDRWGDFWRFTDASVMRLFGEIFGEENVEVRVFGNVHVACSFLNGLASHELSKEAIDYVDPDYQVIIAVKAVKRVS